MKEGEGSIPLGVESCLNALSPNRMSHTYMDLPPHGSIYPYTDRYWILLFSPHHLFSGCKSYCPPGAAAGPGQQGALQAARSPAVPGVDGVWTGCGQDKDGAAL